MKFKESIFVVGLSLLSFNHANALPADAKISIKNTNATYVNRGICSLAFDLHADDALTNIKSIDFTYTLKDKKGTVLENDVITADEFTFVGGSTHGTLYIESESACDAFGANLIISKAVVNHKNGTKAEDIVKTKKLSFDKFIPMKIIISQK